METFPDNLSTPRLKLEPLTVEWMEDLLEQNKGNVARYSVVFKDQNEVHTWINECLDQQDRQERLGMAVLSLDRREFLGVASIQNINITPQLGVWIKEEAQGLGYGQESVQCMIDWFKGTYGQAEKIRYLAEKGNFASIKLARKLGMKSTGDKTNEDGIVFEEFQL